MVETGNKTSSEISKCCILFLPFLCFIGDTVMVKRSKHLNSQNSIEEEKKQQEDGDTPDLFSRSPTNAEKEKAHKNATCRAIIVFVETMGKSKCVITSKC